MTYVLPTEDLEDFNLIRKNYLDIENYDFEKIINKIFLTSIILITFRNDNSINTLTKIQINKNKVIKSYSFKILI